MDFKNRVRLPPQPDVIQIVLAFVVVYLVYNLARVIYNLYFHPLSRFPGPASRAAFAWFEHWPLLKGTHVHDETALHEKYGSVVRIGPNALSFSGGSAWKDIYGTRPGKNQLQKDPKFYVVQKDAPSDIVVADDRSHARMRKLLSHAFSEAALRDQESLMTQYFELLVEKLKHQIDGPSEGKVDITSWYNFTTFDLIGDLAFGEPFHALEKGQYHFWIHGIFEAFKFIRILSVVKHYPVINKLLNTFYALVPSVGEARKRHFDYSAQRVQNRISKKTDRRDFTDYILRYNDDRGMTNGEIERNASILITAGSETTATLLSGATYLLMKNPGVWEKLKTEVRERFKSEDEINITSTGQLRYLFAVLEESHRMYPPIPFRLPRVTGSEGDIIDGRFIPAETSVGVLQYAAHYSEENWHRPKDFLPERWLDDAPTDFAKDKHGTFQPFSTGPRNCLGKNLAYVEMRSILARIAWNFEMELYPESDNWKDQKTYLLWNKPPLWVKLSLREDART